MPYFIGVGKHFQGLSSRQQHIQPNKATSFLPVFILLLTIASGTSLLSQATYDSVTPPTGYDEPYDDDDDDYDDDYDDDDYELPSPAESNIPLAEPAPPPQTKSPFPPEKMAAIQQEMNFNPKADWEQKEQQKAKKREEAARKKREKNEQWWDKWNRNRDIGPLEIPNWLLYLLLLGFVAACGYVIYQLLDGKYLRQPATADEKDSGRVAIEEIQEELITFKETESLLERAVRHEQYELAIRLQFLASLKRLHELGLIVYKKDKVNRAYLFEMDRHALGRDFRQLTLDFERNWYGNYPTDRLSYRLVAKRFEEMQTKLDELERKTHA